MKAAFLTTVYFVLAAAALPVALGREPRAPPRLEKRHPKGENEAVIGIVEKISGQCYVRRKRRGSRTEAVLGMRAFEQDRLITERSRLHVRYKDGTYAELGEESSFGVERMRFKAPNLLPANRPWDDFDESVFRFLYGLVRVTAGDVHPKEHFTVKTANAVIKTAGPADFYVVQLANDRDLTIRVARGQVELMNAVTNEHMLVKEGMGAYLKVSGMVTPAGPLTPDQLAFLKSRTRL